MKIGVPTEIKAQENRVALTPAGADDLVRRGHQVFVQKGAGVGSGYDDAQYEVAGASILADADQVFGECDLVVKVKEPLAAEWKRIRPGQIVFTYLHLAASRELTDALMATGAHCFAYETLEVNRQLPLLTPMSEVAGRMSIQAGATFLQRPNGGLGVLLGGVPGVRRGRVLVLGGGVVGINAARMACGLGADVTIMDVNVDRMRYLDEVMPRNCRTLYSSPYAIREQLEIADLVVGAVLVHGAAAPKLVRKDDLAIMQNGAVIVDVAVDQGGCVETTRPTTHAEPTYVVDGVVHYCVANMPGAVPRTSTAALTNATLRWIGELARLGVSGAVDRSNPLAGAANVIGGQLTCGAVAEAFGMPFVAPDEALARRA
ncbi:MAG: alanine dehydrogenase [Planctomycetota bacterium]